MGLIGRLYRGEAEVEFVGTRKRWYLVSAVLVLVCVLLMVFKGFNWGIEFAGGNSFTFDKPSGVSAEDAGKVIEESGAEVQTTQEAGAGGQTRLVIKTTTLSTDEVTEVKAALAEAYDIEPGEISDSAVSSSWGDQVTEKGIIALVVFLVLVGIYLWIRFEQKMSIAALGALAHDLVLTAGIYSLIGFEVTPSTVIGLLTILGFSLYDTVVVFDKVEENTKGMIKGGGNRTYAEEANLAVNQTIMRSINTSIISLLPVAGLLFVGAGLLGVGTLKDLALVLFVGMLVGAYSSLFLATPWLVDLKMREAPYKEHERRILSRRKKPDAPVTETSEPVGQAVTGDDTATDSAENDTVSVGSGATRTASRKKGRHGRPVSPRRRH